jgi:uncharacterized membrane protein
MSLPIAHRQAGSFPRDGGWIAFAMITIFAVLALLIAPKILQHEAGHTGDLDTGNYSNLAWAILHGEGFRGSVLGRHHLGEHFSPIMMLVAPIYLVVQSADVLMMLQACAVGVGMLACAWMLRPMRLPIVTFLVLCFLHPAVLATWRTQFQPIELGLPLVVLALICIERGGTKWLIPCVVLLLMTRESAPLSVLGLAIYALMTRRWKAGLALALSAGIWFSIVMFVLMPYFRGSEHWVHAKYFGPLAQWDRKSLYLLVLLAGFTFLPLAGPKAVAATMGAIPGIILNLVVDRDTQYTFAGHYDAQVVAFLMFATAQGIVWVIRLLEQRQAAGKPGGYTKSGVLVGALVLSAITSFAMNARGPFRLMRDWWPRDADRQRVLEARVLARKYAGAPALAAHGRIGPQVCHRPNYMTLRPANSMDEWVAWASSRLMPGEILLLPKSGAFKSDTELFQVRRSGRAKLLETTETLEVYQWPLEAPQPGTDAARAYARTGVDTPKAVKKRRASTSKASRAS